MKDLGGFGPLTSLYELLDYSELEALMPSPEERADPGDESPTALKWWWAPKGEPPITWGTDLDRQWFGTAEGFKEKVLPRIPQGFNFGFWQENIPIVRGSVPQDGAPPPTAAAPIDLRLRAVVTFDGEEAKLTLYKHTDQISLPMTSEQLFRLASECLEKGLEAARAGK